MAYIVPRSLEESGRVTVVTRSVKNAGQDTKFKLSSSVRLDCFNGASADVESSASITGNRGHFTSTHLDRRRLQHWVTAPHLRAHTTSIYVHQTSKQPVPLHHFHTVLSYSYTHNQLLRNKPSFPSYPEMGYVPKKEPLGVIREGFLEGEYLSRHPINYVKVLNKKRIPPHSKLEQRNNQRQIMWPELPAQQ